MGRSRHIDFRGKCHDCHCFLRLRSIPFPAEKLRWNSKITIFKERNAAERRIVEDTTQTIKNRWNKIPFLDTLPAAGGIDFTSFHFVQAGSRAEDLRAFSLNGTQISLSRKTCVSILNRVLGLNSIGREPRGCMG